MKSFIKSLISIFTETNNSFEGKEANEEVLFLLRRHPFTILAQLALFILLFFVPILCGIIFFSFILSHNLKEIFFFLSSLWCLILWQVIFYSLTMYTLDVWIVTDHRIIDSTQNCLFNRTVAEIQLSKIQDISVKTEGLIQTFLKFGDLEIQSAGAENKFRFLQIPNPEKIKNAIMNKISTTPH